MRIKSYQQIVIPAKAGIFKIPAFAGMTALMLAIFLTLSLTPPPTQCNLMKCLLILHRSSERGS